MSVRLGNPTEVTATAAALAVSTGRVMSLGGAANQWCVITSILFTYVATATGGNRVAVVQIKDSSGNILWSAAASANITGGQTARIALGGGVPSANVATPNHMFMPLADQLTVPGNSTVTLFDNANVDVADTVAMNLVYSN